MRLTRLVAYLLILSLLTSCRKQRTVNTAFYYWKTVYDNNAVEQQYMDSLHCKRMYVRIMDVNNGDTGPLPVSPIRFKSAIPASVQVVPVVFIVNNVLKNQTQAQLNQLASKIAGYVNGKVKQSGKAFYSELQIDCDWTRSTRSNYFYLLNCIKYNQALKGKQLSATLRLHQLKNQQSSGIPPVNRVMLMCYNMGNLRKYGPQNSILDQQELEKYMGANLGGYPMPVDVGLPLFSWAVVFRQHQYVGIAKRLNADSLNNKQLFTAADNHLYTLLKDLPALGLKQGDEVRWENVPPAQLKSTARYISKYVATDTLNLIYFHLDESTLKNYIYETLEETAYLFR
jgi:hypothetical protein